MCQLPAEAALEKTRPPLIQKGLGRDPAAAAVGAPTLPQAPLHTEIFRKARLQHELLEEDEE